MSELNIHFSYDRKENILFISYGPNTKFDTLDSLERLAQSYQKEIERIGHRVIAIADLINVTTVMDVKITEFYGTKVKELISTGYIYNLIKYNLADRVTSTNIRVGCMRFDMASNIFPDRESAIEKARQIRKEWQAANPKKAFPEPLGSKKF